MSLPRLWTGQELMTFEPCGANGNTFRAFDQGWLSPSIGAGAPAISVAETKDAFEVTAELPGVDEKDIKVSLNENQLVISGEKRAESRKRKRTGMSWSRATAHSTDPCLCLSSRKTEPSTHISTRACCISRSRSPPRRRKSPRQSMSRQALHRASER